MRDDGDEFGLNAVGLGDLVEAVDDEVPDDENDDADRDHYQCGNLGFIHETRRKQIGADHGRNVHEAHDHEEEGRAGPEVNVRGAALRNDIQAREKGWHSASIAYRHPPLDMPVSPGIR